MNTQYEKTLYWQKVENELKERIKELECLYNISSEIESDQDFQKMVTATAHHLRNGFQFPDQACAAIRIDDQEFSIPTDVKEEFLYQISQDIIVAGRSRGWVRVAYQEPADFLPEERRLIKEIANMLSKAVEKHELRNELKRYVGKLEELVRERTAELEKSRHRFEVLFESAPAGLAISTTDGDIIKANRAFYRMLQYPEDGSVKLNYVRDRLYENQAELRPYIFSKLSESGSLEGLEMVLIDSKKQKCPVLASFIFVDMDGHRCVEEIFKDIRSLKELENKLIEQNENLEETVRLRTEDLQKQKSLLEIKNQELFEVAEELRVSRAKLQTLFNAITDTVILVDAHGHVQMSNRPGISSDASCHRVLFNQPLRCADCPVERVFKEKRAVNREKKLNDEYFLLQAYPVLNDEGGIESVLEFCRPITKEKNMEIQLLQSDKLASLGQLVSGVAHEINNPNTFIRGNIQIIQEAMGEILPILDQQYDANPQLRIARLPFEVFRRNIMVLLEDMSQGANRIKAIVEGLRNFARKDDGMMKDDIDVNAAVESSIRLVSNQIRRNAAVKVDLHPNLPMIHGNTQRLQQVLINVLINAAQAIDKKRGQIHVITQLMDGEICLQIQDNGQGMDERTVKQIFDPFFTTKRGQGGTGLGLSIAYGIIKEHKGRIEVESKPHHGTTFSIFLPLTRRETE